MSGRSRGWEDEIGLVLEDEMGVESMQSKKLNSRKPPSSAQVSPSSTQIETIPVGLLHIVKWSIGADSPTVQ